MMKVLTNHSKHFIMLLGSSCADRGFWAFWGQGQGHVRNTDWSSKIFKM